MIFPCLQCESAHTVGVIWCDASTSYVRTYILDSLIVKIITCEN